MDLNALPKRERIAFFATAPRAYTGTICQLEDGDFHSYHVGKLRGRIIEGLDGRWKFTDRNEALAAARAFRANAQKVLERYDATA